MNNSTTQHTTSNSSKTYEINKGIGRTVEFKGLKAQYLFVIFIVVIILYMIGVSEVLCLVLGVLGATILVWQTFTMNRKYGEYGLMKRRSVRKHPRYLTSRRSVSLILRTPQNHKTKTYEK